MLEVKVEKDSDTQVIMGHAGFIKTAEDLYEALVNSVPGIKFGMAFSEASGPCLIRSEGNDPKLIKLAEKNMAKIAAGHTFIILFKDAFPINILGAVKNVYEVTNVYCATANPITVIVADIGNERSVLGVADGLRPKGVEKSEDKIKRRKLLRDIKYKL